jgi:hypothetical protein
MMGDALAILALVFLGLHLLTDAWRMVLVLLTRQHKVPSFQHREWPYRETPCPRCEETSDTLKEAWWEVLTFFVLIGHIALDYV